MQTYAKKRIDLIIELPLLRRVTDALQKAGVAGYSVLPVIAGNGHYGPWSADAQAGATGQMAAIVCVLDEAKVDAALDAVFAVVRRQIGFVTVSDVAVIRSERF